MDLFPIPGPWTGRLAVCSRPRAGHWLEDDIRALGRSGHDLLISALTPEEVVKVELATVPEICGRYGVRFVHFPVGNLQVPDPDVTRGRLEEWNRHLSGGGGIAVHCWASVGRSPTIAAALLVFAGVPSAEAWARIRTSRGREVPDTNEQRDWVTRFEQPK